MLHRKVQQLNKGMKDDCKGEGSGCHQEVQARVPWVLDKRVVRGGLWQKCKHI